MAFHPDDLDLYVMGALPDERCTVIEAHVSQCAECAARLAAEARLELQLHEVAAAASAATATTNAPAPSPATIASAPRRSERPVTRRRRRVAAWSALAAVAAALLAIGGARLLRHTAPSAPDPIVVVCPFDDGARACVDSARQHGLFVQFPVARPVPIYENASPAAGSIATAF